MNAISGANNIVLFMFFLMESMKFAVTYDKPESNRLVVSKKGWS